MLSSLCTWERLLPKSSRCASLRGKVIHTLAFVNREVQYRGSYVTPLSSPHHVCLVTWRPESRFESLADFHPLHSAIPLLCFLDLQIPTALILLC